MDSLNSQNQVFNFRASKSESALVSINQQIEFLHLGSAHEYGIIDRSEQSFLLYRHYSSPIHRSPTLDLVEWPSLSALTNQLSEADRRFLDESLTEVHKFQKRIGPDNFMRYRLSFDFSVGTDLRHCLRVLVHLRYFAPDDAFPEGLCLFYMHRISGHKPYAPPLRAFCRYPSLKPVLFKRGAGHFPNSSEKTREFFADLQQGQSIKQVADRLGYPHCTVNNRLAEYRSQLSLANNTQLVHYMSCFESI